MADVEKTQSSIDIIHLLEEYLGQNTLCPKCGGHNIAPWGIRSGLHRHRCQECGRTFNVLAGTPLARLRYKDKWLPYLRTMASSQTLRQAAAECEVSLDTAFRWRHRFLARMATHPTPLSNIVEADETYIRISAKGDRHLEREPHQRGSDAVGPGRSSEDWVAVLVVRDRNEHTVSFVLPHFTAEAVIERVQPLIAKDALLITDGAATFESFAKQAEISHHPVYLSAGARVRGAFHIQNVNACHRRLKEWLIRFHGVATKYLSHYLGWRRMLERLEELLTPAQVLRAALGFG
jgi:transposase-like protein